MAAFLAVVDEEGFSAAARKLKVSPSVITRAVTELEERLGTRLLTRTQYPDVAIHCWFIDRKVNLVDEGVDVAVRIGELPDSSLQAIRVGNVRQVLCAAPAYLQRHGVPQRPEDLDQHIIVAATGVTPTPEYRFRDDLKIRLQPRMTTTTNESAAATAAAGFGITRLPLYQIAPALQRGELQLVLEAFERPPLPIHVVHREGRNATRKIRSFIDMTVDALRGDPSLQ